MYNVQDLTYYHNMYIEYIKYAHKIILKPIINVIDQKTKIFTISKKK